MPHENGCVSLDAIAAAITPRTRLVSVSWVQFLSGHRIDVAALADIVHDRGALLCVDAIQGLGALRLDVGASGIDFLACGVQKWWMGPQGLAFLYCAPHLVGRLNGRAGWLHGPVDWDNFLDYDLAFFPDARRFRIGTLNAIGAMLFRAALSLYEDAGPDACHARVLGYGRHLRDGLHALGQPHLRPARIRRHGHRHRHLRPHRPRRRRRRPHRRRHRRLDAQPHDPRLAVVGEHARGDRPSAGGDRAGGGRACDGGLTGCGADPT